MNKNEIISALTKDQIRTDLPKFNIGDTVKVVPNAKYVYCNTFSKLLQGKHMYIRKLKGTTATLSFKSISNGNFIFLFSLFN